MLKKFTTRTSLIGIGSTVFVLSTIGIVYAVAWGGGVLSVTKIASGTTNFSTLVDSAAYGTQVANAGDINNDGVNDLLSGMPNVTGGGQVILNFMNANGSVQSSFIYNASTTSGATVFSGDSYGSGVAGIGDLNLDGVPDIAIGAETSDWGGLNYGGIFIHFMNANGTFRSTVNLNHNTANGPVMTTQENYGRGIVSLGDLNLDGVQDLLVGSPLHHVPSFRGGAAFIHFMNTDGSVDSTAEINSTTTNGPSANLDQEEYGTSVATLGDLDGDGVTEIAVGVPKDDTGGANRGAVYIHFMNTNGTLDSTTEISSGTTNGPTLIDSDGFGFRVAGVGDLDGDGVEDIAVGANGDDTGGSARGTVYIIYLNSNGSVKSFSEINSSTTNGPTLTNSDQYSVVANMGDLDVNGIIDLAVGAFGDDTGGNARGAVHITYLGDTASTSGSSEETRGSGRNTFLRRHAAYAISNSNKSSHSSASSSSGSTQTTTDTGSGSASITTDTRSGSTTDAGSGSTATTSTPESTLENEPPSRLDEKPKTNVEQHMEDALELREDRICARVILRLSAYPSVMERVNKRLEKWLGFSCSEEKTSSRILNTVLNWVF